MGVQMPLRSYLGCKASQLGPFLCFLVTLLRLVKLSREGRICIGLPVRRAQIELRWRDV